MSIKNLRTSLSLLTATAITAGALLLPFAQAQAATEEVVVSYAYRNNFWNPDGVRRFRLPWRVTSNSYQVRTAGDGDVNQQGTRVYFGFDLSNVQGTVTAAKLRIEHPGNSYDSSDASETVEFYSIDNWRIEQLENPPGFGGRDETSLATLGRIFDDLGDGAVYGRFTATEASNNSIEEITLNAAALRTINTRAGTSRPWLTGAALISGAATGFNVKERVFRGSDTSAGNDRLTELVLTVDSDPNAGPKSAPVLGGWLGFSLLGLGLSGAGAGAMRRRNRS